MSQDDTVVHSDRSGTNGFWWLAAAGVGFAAYAAVKAARQKYNFAGRTVLITGGARGLGLVIARMLADRGARIAICSRTADELDRAERELEQIGADVFAQVCDIRDKAAVEEFTKSVIDRFGRLDVVINNAGVIQVGPLEAQAESDFDEAMKTHFWGAYYVIQAAIPHMRRRGEGRIVNIASIGGKIAVPHLAPYCASKFALAGLSSAMHSELARENISVTTVFPGLMRTGSHVNALFKGQNEKEYALFSIMDALPISSVSAESAARQIIDAAAAGQAELIVSPQAKLAAKLNSLFPNVAASLLAATARILPGNGGVGRENVRGLDSTSSASPSILTALADAASYRNNELAPTETIN